MWSMDGAFVMSVLSFSKCRHPKRTRGAGSSTRPGGSETRPHTRPAHTRLLANGAAQDVKELVDACFLFFGHVAGAAEQAGIKFFSEQRVLEALHHPVDDRDDDLYIEVLAQFAAFQAEAHESDSAVWVFGDQKAIDLAPQGEVGSIVPHQVNAIRDPVLAHHVLGADQPVAQDLEKAAGADIGRHIEIRREGARRLLVGLEEKAVFASEMLEDGTLGNAQFLGNVADAGGFVTLSGKMAHGHLDNTSPLGFGARAKRLRPGGGCTGTHS